ncbi:MAG TPA: hypothetical protein VFL96_16790 [Acidobacteriaceae bacterium]|nr:hypothetical protein [Acidobacteriaceae bacterium]
MHFTSILAAAAAAAQAAAPQASIQPAPAASIAPAAPQAVILAPAAGSVLHAGTEVPLRMEEGLDSNDKSLREGQQFRMTVANDVRLGNVVVIPAGSPATGEITDIRRKGMWGKSGRINARVLNVRVGERLIRLTGNFNDKGVTGTAGVVGAIVFVPIAGFFLTGTSAKIPAGGGVKAFLDEDLQIAMPAPPPQPVVAPPPAPASAAVQVQAAASAPQH